jgi:hypothetical protein
MKSNRNCIEATGFFTTGESNGHLWFVTPEGQPFFSIGLNHIDSSSLRYLHTIDIWNKKYNGDQHQWIKQSVMPSLRQWGFNTIGWVQEVVIRDKKIHRHSRNWIHEEYKSAEMPFCHMLPFAEVHEWEVETRYPDVFSDGFEEWCDYIARETCAVMVDDPNLIGYFFSDCPSWTYKTHNPELKGAWFDPERLKTEFGCKELAAMAERYYKVTHDSIRRYDKNHLILGDRFHGSKFIPDEVICAAARYVDVLSFQYSAETEITLPYFEKVYNKTHLPILLADAAVPRDNTKLPLEKFRIEGKSYDGQGEKYQAMMEDYFSAFFMVGWHYCGAFMENEVRQQGLYSMLEKPNEGLVKLMSEKNLQIIERIPIVDTIR